MTQGGAPYLIDTYSEDNTVDQIYNIGAMIRRMIASVIAAMVS